MEASSSSARPRRQSRLDRLSTLLLSNPTIRRWWDNLPASASTGTDREKQQPTPSTSTTPSSQPARPPTPPPLPPQNAPLTADPDAPIGILLPGMRRLTLTDNTNPQLNHALGPALHHTLAAKPLDSLFPTSDSKPPLPFKVFTPAASSTPDLILSKLPLEIQSLIFEEACLSLTDLVSLRNSCRTLRRDLPIGVMERKLTAQNYAGWDVVFEMHGHRYPGTTYGNRRLCGMCVVPKIRGLLIEGVVVREYLKKRGLNRGEGEEEWPEERGMCFPCLWWTLVKAEGVEVSDREIWKVAGITTEERFRMLDGTDRKICEKCRRDIHENAVPCPHCTDFSDWCHGRRGLCTWS